MRIIKRSSSYNDWLKEIAQEKGLKISGRSMERGKHKRWKKGCRVFNWGVSSDYIPNEYKDFKWINCPINVRFAVNKSICLDILEDYSVPFTFDREEAVNWLHLDKKVFVRTKVCSSKGNGIIVADNIYDLPDAPLYTMAIEKQREVRVNVRDGEIFLLLGKKKRNGTGGRDPFEIWNYGNGYIYTPNVQPISEEAQQMAIDSVSLIGLDFAAVDMIKDKQTGKWYVVELNTAPGVYGETTKQAYRAMFEHYRDKFSHEN